VSKINISTKISILCACQFNDADIPFPTVATWFQEYCLYRQDYFYYKWIQKIQSR